MSVKKVSVVVATYNRARLLHTLVDDLARQTLPPDEFEVILIDDGSREPVAPYVEEWRATKQIPYSLIFEAQENTGQAGARDKGIRKAQGEIVVIVDDDMELPPDFLEAHLRAHAQGIDVVMGLIVPPPGAELPLFERFHADQLLRFAEGAKNGERPVRGVNLATGNVSFKRQDYIEVGGFDRDLKRSEDRELGIRFEKKGKRLGFSDEAKTIHNSDHASLEVWLKRSFNYGVYDRRISKKHDDVESADPWSFLFVVAPVSRPIFLFTVAFPDAAASLSQAAMKVSQLLAERGQERVALKGCTFVYGVEYFRGLRSESGSLPGALSDLLHYALDKRGRAEGVMSRSGREGGKGRLQSALAFVSAVKGDYDALLQARAKYHGDTASYARLPLDLVTKVGFQMMAAVRVMELMKETRVPFGAEVVSRLLRHVYGAEIHWDAALSPGIALVHGNGLVISHAATVKSGCILFHNVTLGEGMDPETRERGAPTLEEGVHVGPGATLLGPITVGAGSKIMAGAVLNRSVPAGSLVTPAPAIVTERRRPTLKAVEGGQSKRALGGVSSPAEMTEE